MTSANKPPVPPASPDQDTSSADGKRTAGRLPEGSGDSFDLSRMSPQEIAAELARRSQSARPNAGATSPQRPEPFAHITHAVGPSYEERQRFKAQYVEERYRRDEEEMSAPDLADSGLPVAAFMVREHQPGTDQANTDQAGAGIPKPAKPIAGKFDRQPPAGQPDASPAINDQAINGQTVAGPTTAADQPAHRLGMDGDSLDSPALDHQTLDHQDLHHQSADGLTAHRSRDNDMRSDERVAARSDGRRMPDAPPDDTSRDSSGSRARRSPAVAGGAVPQAPARDPLAGYRPELRDHISIGGDNLSAEMSAAQPMPPMDSHADPRFAAQRLPADMPPPPPPSRRDYFGRDTAESAAASMPRRGLDADGMAARRDDLRADLRAPHLRAADLDSADPRPPRRADAVWPQPAPPRLRWERAVALALILAALLAGPAIYYYPWLNAHWTQMRSAIGHVAASLDQPGAAGSADATPAAAPSPPMPSSTAPSSAGLGSGSAASGTPSADIPPANPASTQSQPAAAMMPLSAAASSSPPNMPATSAPTASVPITNAPAMAVPAASATATHRSTMPDIDTAAGGTAGTMPQSLATQSGAPQSLSTQTATVPSSTTLSNAIPGGATSGSTASSVLAPVPSATTNLGNMIAIPPQQSPAGKPVKTKSAASDSAKAGHPSLDLTPSPAWLKAQPYDPGKAAQTQAMPLQPASQAQTMPVQPFPAQSAPLAAPAPASGTPDAWLKARPYDPGVLMVPQDQ